MRILYFLGAVMLVVVLIVGCTGEPQGIVDPVKITGMVPPLPIPLISTSANATHAAPTPSQLVLT